MRVSMFAAVALLLPASCAAQFQFVSYMAHNNSLFSVPVTDASQLGPLDFNFSWQWEDWEMTWHVEDLMPSDQGTVWEVRSQEDAAPFGFDFDRAVDYSLNHWPEKVIDFGNGGPVKWLLPEVKSTIDTPLGRFEKGICCMMTFNDASPTTRVRLDYVRFYLSMFRSVPNENRVYVEMHTYLIGSKIRPVPEPASAALLVLGLCAIGWRRAR